jgi:hypothetical protein
LLPDIVESKRCSGGKVLQRRVLYLGEINDSQQEAWRRVMAYSGLIRAYTPTDTQMGQFQQVSVLFRTKVAELRDSNRWPSRARRDFELILSSPVNAHGLLAARAFLIAIDARASVFSFWRRSQASQSSPRRKADRSRPRGDAANTGRVSRERRLPTACQR